MCISITPIIQWCDTHQGFLSGCLTLVYVVATLCLVGVARRQLALATTLERNRTRPFVIFDLVLRHSFVFAEVRNSGQTPARDVRITIAPRLRCVASRGESQFKDIAFIQRGIAMLAPGRSITALVGHWNGFRGAYPGLRFDGTISYWDSTGQQYPPEPFIADLSAQEGLLYLGIKDIDDVARQLEAIAHTIDHLASGFSKPLVRIVTENDYQAQQLPKSPNPDSPSKA